MEDIPWTDDIASWFADRDRHEISASDDQTLRVWDLSTLPVPLVEEDTDYARLRDPGTGAIWTVELDRGVYLDLGMDHWSELVIDARRQTRSLFESMMSARWPRLDDPAFSPLIEIERFVLPGGAGLYVLHRSHMVAHRGR